MMRVLAISICLLMLSTSSNAQQMTYKEKAMFITPQYMGSYGFVFDQPEKKEQYTKTPFTEKSVEYDYSFKCIDESCKQTLAIQQSVSIEATEKDADSTYNIDEQTILASLGKFLTYKAYASFYPCGKRWEYKMLFSATNEKPVGFIYHYQKGKYTATLMIVGFNFDDPEQFKDFMEPLVKKTDEVVGVL